MTTAINEQIKILAELQKLDGEIYHLKKELSGHPELQKAAEASFEKKKANFKKADEDVKGIQKKQKESELDLQSKEDKIKKLQGQLYQLKTNKEYSAMDLEIKGLIADKSLLEEDILRFLDAVEEAKGKLAKEKELLAVEEKKFKEETDALKKQAAQLGSEIAGIEERRKQFVPNLDPRLVSQYERILTKREGLALAAVKNNACGGCHLELPPQIVNEISMHDKIITCEQCARILYAPA